MLALEGVFVALTWFDSRYKDIFSPDLRHFSTNTSLKLALGICPRLHSYLGFWSGAGFLITSFLAIIMSVRPRYSETGLLEKVLYIFLMTLTSLISAGTCWLLVLLQLSPVFWCGEVATSTNEVPRHCHCLSQIAVRYFEMNCFFIKSLMTKW